MKTQLLIITTLISYVSLAEIKQHDNFQTTSMNNASIYFSSMKIGNETINTFNNHSTTINGVAQPYSYYVHNVNNFIDRELISEVNTRVTDIFWNNNITKLYGRKYLSNDILLINPQNGTSTTVSTLSGVLSGQAVQAMTIDHLDICYVVSVGIGTSTVANLYTCNINTGVLTHIGSQTQAVEILDMTADCEGTLYAFDSTTKKTWTLDKNTGAATVLSIESVNPGSWNHLTYDRVNGELYQFVRTAPSTYYFANVDKQNGALTALSSTAHGVFLGDFKNTCPTEVEETFPLNPGFNGSWYNPQTNGQGMFFDILPDSNTYFGAWFTFANSPPELDETSEIGSTEHRWLTVQGELGNENTVNLTIRNTIGGIFNDPTTVTSNSVGIMTIKFDDCSNGEVNFAFDNEGPIGSFPIQRIVNDNVKLCESLIPEEE